MTHRLPGLIDVHVHFRYPGQTHKEDFDSGSRAALKGGFTQVLDMPNNVRPTVDLERIAEKARHAAAVANCDIGFHYGTDGHNVDSFPAAAASRAVFGLKVYMNPTTGDLLLEDPELLDRVFAGWNSDKPILVHAEGEKVAVALELAERHARRLHVCHIPGEREVDFVREARGRGQRVTAGACPHHLYLTAEARRTHGGLAEMKPPLGNDRDRDALWAAIADGTIDLVETDHAPHTLEEKRADPAPFGVPGLETALGLLCLGVRDGRLTIEDIRRLLHDAPRAIFAIPEQPRTWIDVDLDRSWIVGQSGYESRCGWSPFEGWELPGFVDAVVLRGQAVVREGRVVAP